MVADIGHGGRLSWGVCACTWHETWQWHRTWRMDVAATSQDRGVPSSRKRQGKAQWTRSGSKNLAGAKEKCRQWGSKENRRTLGCDRGSGVTEEAGGATEEAGGGDRGSWRGNRGSWRGNRGSWRGNRGSWRGDRGSGRATEEAQQSTTIKHSKELHNKQTLKASTQQSNTQNKYTSDANKQASKSRYKQVSRKTAGG
jgi:hypothetical protein